MLFALGVPSWVDAQGSRLSGRVYHVTPQDSVGLPGRAVSLHRLEGPGGTVVDSTQTDTAGRYTFNLATPDTGSMYFVSVEHQDIGYLSPTMELARGGAVSVESIVVYDTSYSSPAIDLRERHIIVRHEDVDGTRQMIELLTLGNSGRFTRIAADTSDPVWQGLLPAGAFGLAIGESEVGSGAVYLRGGRLAIAAPIPPGEKQLLVSYIVPGNNGDLSILLDQPVSRLTLSLEDTSAVATGTGLALYGVEQVGGVAFRRYDAGNLVAGTTLSVRFQTAVVTVGRLKVFLILAAVFALAGTLGWWLRQQRTTAVP